MERRTIGAIALAIALASGTMSAWSLTAGDRAEEASPRLAATASKAVAIKDFKFQPATITIPKGTTVRWTNQDQAAHTATSDTGVWDSALLQKGESYERRFDQPGKFPYHCTPHPYMKGTIEVK